jgi:uncharacterized protein involved in exopolysaccharide biosynthesis
MTYENSDELQMDMSALAMAFVRNSFRIIIVTIILLVITYMILQFIPKKYESSASILVESRNSVFTRAVNDNFNSSAGLNDPSIAKSHAALIKSRDNIALVIEREGLLDVAELNGSKASIVSDVLSIVSPKPSAQTLETRVILAVAKRTKVIQLPDSRVLKVSFRSTDPLLSARVANALVNSHVQRRSEQYISDTGVASKWLLSEIEVMRTHVAKAEEKVAAFRIDNDLFVGANNTNILDQQLSNIATQITAAQERRSRSQSRVTLIRKLLDAGRSVDGVPDVRNSLVVQRLVQDKATLQGNRAQLLATFLPNHPDIKALSAQIAEIDKQIRNEGRQIANSLEAEAKIEFDLEQSLRDDLARLKIDVSGATKSSVVLAELEREAKAQRDLLGAYLIRYRDASARTGSSAVLPDVRVTTVAAPAIKPASPKKGFILLAVGIGSLVLQFGGVLFSELLSGRAIKQPMVVKNQESAEDERERLTKERKNNDENIKHVVLETLEKAMMNAQNLNTPPPAPVSVPPAPVVSAPPISNDNMSNGISEDIFVDTQKLSEQISRYYKLVLVSAIGSANDSNSSTQVLTSNLIENGSSLAEVDAGSKRISSNPGITDLCIDIAEFGDVVQRRSQSNFAFIPWGQQDSLNLNSPNAKILVDALNEIFETVLVDVGRAGMTSSLPAFVGADALVLLVVDENVSKDNLDSVSQDIKSMGFANISIVKSASYQAKVA